jgi:hypothetical protein
MFLSCTTRLCRLRRFTSLPTTVLGKVLWYEACNYSPKYPGVPHVVTDTQLGNWFSGIFCFSSRSTDFVFVSTLPEPGNARKHVNLDGL